MRNILTTMLLLASLSAEAALVNIGYKKEITTFWAYDGFGQPPVDCTIGGAIRITPDMYQDYLGAEVKSLRIGWSNPNYSSNCTTFLRQNLTDKTDLLAGSGVLTWNPTYEGSYEGDYTVIDFDSDTPFTLTEDLDTFYVGFYAEKVKKGTYALASSYPAYQEGSALIWGDIDGYNYDEDGNEIWEDQCSYSALCLELVVEGNFDNKVKIENLIAYPTMIKDQADDGLMTILNKGTNTVTDFTLEYAFGEEKKTESFHVDGGIKPGSTTKVIVPVYAIGHGNHSVTITALDGQPNNIAQSFTYQTVAVPESVSRQYKRKSLSEFFESENVYYVPYYYDSLFCVGLEPYRQNVEVVAQHMDDQWMLGDDDGTHLMLWLCDNDSSACYCPAESVDRSPNILLYANRVECSGTFHSIITPMFADLLWEVPLARPTYADLSVECLPDGDKATVKVSGNIAEDILADEHLYLTVALLEDDVYTDSQAQQELGKGEYYHDNLQRLCLTDSKGDLLDVNSGHFEKTYVCDIYPDEWNLGKMRVVAFLNRAAEGNDKWNRDIVNSASCPLDASLGIEEVENAKCCNIENYYNLAGQKVAATAKGLIIANGRKILR